MATSCMAVIVVEQAQEGFWSIITCNLMKVKRLLGAAEVVIPATNLMLCLLISGLSVGAVLT